MNTQSQRAFVLSECFTLTLGGTVQRGNVYVPGLSESARKPVQITLREELEALRERYTLQVTEPAHTENIVRLSATMSEKHKAVLFNGRFRIGNAQKALNLHLKYMWCLGLVEMPPHCPIDAVVLRHVPEFEHIKWTQLDDIDRYSAIISAAKRRAGGRALAIWELELWNGET